jgi:hypothetical protein
MKATQPSKQQVLPRTFFVDDGYNDIFLAFPILPILCPDKTWLSYFHFPIFLPEKQQKRIYIFLYPYVSNQQSFFELGLEKN